MKAKQGECMRVRWDGSYDTQQLLIHEHSIILVPLALETA